ncbi:hypothetical protein ABFA25_04625 [Mycobacterium lepromatosis]
MAVGVSVCSPALGQPVCPRAVLVPCWFHSSSMTSQPVMTRTAVL